MKQDKCYQSLYCCCCYWFFKRTHWSQQILFSNNTRDGFTHEHHQMVNTEIRRIIFFVAKVNKFYIVGKNKNCIWLWPRSSAPCCKIQAKIEESRENHWPYRYDLNQIPYDYTVEMMKKFKRLDVVDTVPENLQTEVPNIVQEVVVKNIQEKEMQDRKVVV